MSKGATKPVDALAPAGDAFADSRLAVSADGWPVRVVHGDGLEKVLPLLREGAVSAADVAILDIAADRFELASDPDVALAFAFALAAPRQGHVGVELRRLAARLQDARGGRSTSADRYRGLDVLLPADALAWQARVLQHPAVAQAQPRPTRPFVFQPLADLQGAATGILMTCRMWRQQRRLADALLTLATATPSWRPAQERLRAHMDAVYGAQSEDNREARHIAETVAREQLTVITGGPGTGKTWGIKRVLAILLETAAAEGKQMSVQLAAPTGKAALRMAEAMADEAQLRGVEPATLQQLVDMQPRTLHRLLGVLPHAPQRFRHGRKQRLNADIVVVDEASMIDLVMMRHLVESIADGKRLVLLGDCDQLASVEAGTVLADIVSGGASRQSPPTQAALSSNIARLTVSHRFGQAASIACLAEGLQLHDRQSLADVVSLMCGQLPGRSSWAQRVAADPRDTPAASQRVTWLNGPSANKTAGGEAATLTETTLRRLAEPYLGSAVDNLRHDGVVAPQYPGAEPGYFAMLAARLADPQNGRLDESQWHEQLLQAFGRYRILAAHRRGPRGVEELNTRLTARARQFLQDAVATAGAVAPLPNNAGHWLGRPVMITRNSYEVNLRNGDIGLVLPHTNAAGRQGLYAVFVAPRESVPNASSRVRYVALARLPDHETALAMTVHKSQGSQFERVALVLPHRVGSPILTRELIYTAATRARWRVTWVGSKAVLADALQRNVERASGLQPLLWP